MFPEDEIRWQLQARQYAEAFSLLVDCFKDKVFRLALSMSADPAQAEDLAQDVFIKVWKNLPGYRGESSLSTWIYAITRNTCRTEWKKRAAHPTVCLQDTDWEQIAERVPALRSAEPDSALEMDVRSLLAVLPERYRQVISLFYLEQKSYEEVASMLGLPLGTVKTFLFRARKELLRIASRPAGHLNVAPGRGEAGPKRPTGDPRVKKTARDGARRPTTITPFPVS